MTSLSEVMAGPIFPRYLYEVRGYVVDGQIYANIGQPANNVRAVSDFQWNYFRELGFVKKGRKGSRMPPGWEIREVQSQFMLYDGKGCLQGRQSKVSEGHVHVFAQYLHVYCGTNTTIEHRDAGAVIDPRRAELMIWDEQVLIWGPLDSDHVSPLLRSKKSSRGKPVAVTPQMKAWIKSRG